MCGKNDENTLKKLCDMTYKTFLFARLLLLFTVGTQDR